MSTETQICAYRGKALAGSTFVCEVHGKCSLEYLHDRIRACSNCSDRREGIQGFQDKSPTLLGDVVENALTSVGITESRVSSWLGVECHCEERKQKLNMLHSWARRVVSGKVEGAKELLDKIIGGWL